MQFSKAQGGSLAALGLLLLALQLFLLFSSARQPSGSAQATETRNPGERATQLIPGIVGLLALAGGAYLVLQPRKKAIDDEAQPAKTKSGFPM
jgi:hypothetical protein